MKIVIIGDGKVGYKLAKQLSSEKYDIILIDNNEEKLRKSIERMDVFCVAGEGGSVEVQQRADVPHADLVIACTSTDECNMLSCLIARRLGARHTIARVRNPIYYKQIDFLKKDLHLSMVVNPELIVAGDITRLLLFPDASKVETFVKGRVELVEFPIHCGKLEGLSLSELYARFQVQVLVCAVESGETVLIPDGDYILKAGDKLHIAASHQNMEQFFKKIALRKEKIKNAMICGGGRVEALEFIIKSENAYTGVPLKDLNLKVNNIIACIARGRKIIIPNGDDSIQVGDSVVIITMTKQIRDLDDILVKR